MLYLPAEVEAVGQVDIYTAVVVLPADTFREGLGPEVVHIHVTLAFVEELLAAHLGEEAAVRP